jgi:hypothetical protein
MSMRRTLAAGLTVLQLALAAGVLSACKSGGGGGGGPPAPPAGSFTLSTSSLTFSAKTTAQLPVSQSVVMTITGSGVAAVGAGYGPGVVQPSWLTVDASGSGQQYTILFFPTTTFLTPGTYTTTVTIGTGDANGNILQTRDVQVTYTIRDGVHFTSAPPILSGVAGSSQSSQTVMVSVAAPAGVQWQASSSQSWLQVPGGTQTGSALLTVTVDPSTLPPGQATATLTLTNVADATDNAAQLVTMNLSVPVLTTTLPQIDLGGDSGLETAPVSLGFALGTGSNAYPWTLTATTTTGGDWLTVSSAAGTVAASNVTVDVDADRTQLSAGTYTGQLELRATVPGAIVTRTVPVTLKYEANRVLVSDIGVAFSSFPSRQVLTRTLTVYNTLRAPGIPWQATAISSPPWLAATLSGDTEDPLVLTANPAGLSEGQYFGEVTVGSPSAAITNTETIRVGLTVRGTDPTGLIDLPAVRTEPTVANPVEPEVFVSNSGTIEAYDVYSGALLRTLPATGGVPQALAMSGDGRSLYVAEDVASGDRILELDPVNGGTPRRTFLIGSQAEFLRFAMAHARPDTHPVLVTTAQGEIFDATTGAKYSANVIGGYSIDVSSDQRYVYTLNSFFSPANIYRYELRFSNLAAAGLSSVRLVERSIGANGQDVAVSSDDTVLYAVTMRDPTQFDTLAPDTLLETGSLLVDRFPNNVETCWNGLVAGGTDRWGDPLGDTWIYDEDDTFIVRLEATSGDNNSLVVRSLQFSGDCTRLVSAGGDGLRIQNVPAP